MTQTPSDFITAYDADGHEISISRQEWSEKVLPNNLQLAWNDPENLYQSIVQALQDGFFQEVLAASAHLVEIDPNAERAYCLRGITLMQLRQFDAAEAVLLEYCAKHGESPYALTNLAKVHSYRGDEKTAREKLLHSLQLDPNQENALLWWGAIQKEEGGEPAFLKGMLDLALIPGSWRPQYWVGRSYLEQGDTPQALKYYREVLKASGDDSGILMSISGDLGQRGLLDEIVQLIVPHYQPDRDRIEVGLNLLQCYLLQENAAEGLKLLAKLRQLNRWDMAPHLNEFEAALNQLA